MQSFQRLQNAKITLKFHYKKKFKEKSSDLNLLIKKKPEEQEAQTIKQAHVGGSRAFLESPLPHFFFKLHKS